MDKLTKDIASLVTAFNESITQHLPGLEQEINQIIERKSRDESGIENMLDTILSLTMHGFADDLYIKLLEYYKTVNPEGAEFYWNEYDKNEDQ